MWKRILGLAALGLAGFLALGQVGPVLGETVDAVDSQDGVGSGFAVLELFTSEGCSSCPPADELLAELARHHGADSVYALSFHVDYWNSLGWRDPFSDESFSQRQESYARALNEDGVYTPQLVVNGRAQTVGSRGAAVRGLIARALQKPSHVAPAIELTARQGSSSVQTRHRVTGAPAGAKLALLVVQRLARSVVTRGENSGQTLLHANVVRSLSTVSADGATALELPSDLNAADAFVVALLQDPSTREIFAAARAPIAR
jgi:hypothetical protein